MNFLLRIGAIFIVALKRLVSQWRLALLTAVGLTVAVALTLSVPLYADAVYYRTLREALQGKTADVEPRPPFAFMFRYIGGWYGAVKWEDIQTVDQYLTGQGPADLGLPKQLSVRFFRTDNLGLFPAQAETAYLSSQRPLGWVTFGTASDIESHINIIEGQLPSVATGPVEGPIEVLMSVELATALGLHTGESFTVFGDKAAANNRPVQIPVRVTGLWEAKNAAEDYWFYKPQVLSDLLLVPEGTFIGQVVPRLDKPIYVALWYMVMDGSKIRSNDAGSLLGRINMVRQQSTSYLPNTNLDVSPVEALQKYQTSSNLLTILLYAYSIPIIGLVLAFIGLVVGLTVGQQRNEIAVLRSRGATTVQVVGIAALEALVLGGLAILAAWKLSEQFAQAIGRAQSFLNFSATSALSVLMSPAILRFALITIGVALVAQLVPTIGAARHTIITYKQERARAMRAPWWQRADLDIFLLIPAAYGLYLLRKQGSIVLPVGGALPSDPFSNPLLFLVPALGMFALTLVMLRVLPILMAIVVWIASRTGAVGVLLAARHLERTPGFYTAPLVLLVLTLSLSAFTASLAQTLDNHLWDQTYYQVGADMSVVELGESTQTSTAGGASAFGATGSSSSGGSGSTATPAEETGPRWLFLPVSEYLKVPGVLASARVGRYAAAPTVGSGRPKSVFMGVDRVDFGRVAFWREDFAPASLGSLMNALATTPEGVLAWRDFMAQNALSVGDKLQVQVDVYGERRELEMKIVGYFDLFPSWYPEEDGALFVGNLDYLYEQVGGQFPYDVWLRTDPSADGAKILAGARDMKLRILQADDSVGRILAEQARPERQGLFGLLSVGFLAAALLTVLGFLLYALFSFRRRFIELGILRAIGLSSGQMTSALAWELAFLIITGLLAGTGTGAWVSQLFIPYLQVGAGSAAHTPPYLVEIAWPAIFRIYELFGVLFVVALTALGALLLRMKIFQAVKLGETV